MSDEVLSSKPRRRWRRLAIGVIALVLVYVAGSAWWSYRWLDPRFVGAWRVTNSKWDGEAFYILKVDGSARTIERRWQGDPWWERGARGAPFYWSIGRDGFLLQNLDSSGAQIGRWLWSLGGLLDNGKLTVPKLVTNRDSQIEFVSDDLIRLNHTQPGIIIPTILTLERMDPAEVPRAQP